MPIALADKKWNLISDSGGSSTRLARVASGIITDVETFPTTNKQSIPEIISEFVAQYEALPSRAVIAFAAPIVSCVVRLTNAHSNFKISDIAPLTLDGSVDCLNDFEAAAWAL